MKVHIYIYNIVYSIHWKKEHFVNIYYIMIIYYKIIIIFCYIIYLDIVCDSMCDTCALWRTSPCSKPFLVHEAIIICLRFRFCLLTFSRVLPTTHLREYIRLQWSYGKQLRMYDCRFLQGKQRIRPHFSCFVWCGSGFFGRTAIVRTGWRAGFGAVVIVVDRCESSRMYSYKSQGCGHWVSLERFRLQFASDSLTFCLRRIRTTFLENGTKTCWILVGLSKWLLDMFGCMHPWGVGCVLKVPKNGCHNAMRKWPNFLAQTVAN